MTVRHIPGQSTRRASLSTVDKSSAITLSCVYVWFPGLGSPTGVAAAVSSCLARRVGRTTRIQGVITEFLAGKSPSICRVGQNRIYTPYMNVYLVISLPKIPYIHRIYMVLANPKYMVLYGV